MSEVELKITADAAGASREIGGFRKEYQELVRAVEKPLRQIDALKQTQESAKAASTAYFAARKRVDELKTAMEQAGQPVKELERELVKAERALAKTTLAFDKQKNKVREQRAELRAAGVDVRNLAAEQARLQQSMQAAVGRGRGDAAIKSAMDQFGVSQLRNLRTQLVTLDADYRRLTQSGVLSARERATAEIQYQAQVNRTKQAIRELGQEQATSGGGIQALATRLAGLVAAAYTVQRAAGAFFDITDAVGTMEDRLSAVTSSQDEYNRSLASLEETSKRVRIPLAQTSELFLGAIGPLREMGFSATVTADMVAALSAGLVVNNVKGDQAAAVIDNLSKGLQTGVIRGDAFNAMLTRSPALIDALTTGLGVTREELIRMAAAGELTTEKFVTALASQSESLLQLADNMRVTVGDAQVTFSDSIDRVVVSIDKLTGFSAKAVEELDELSNALDNVSKGDIKALIDYGANNRPADDLLSRANQLGFKALAAAYEAFSDDAQDAVDELVTAEQEAADKRRSIEEEDLAARRGYAQQFNGITSELTDKFKAALDEQVAAQRKATTALSKAQSESLATEKRYKDALEKLRAGAAGPASYNNAQSLTVAARDSLSRGDIEGAKRNAQAALEMLNDLAEAGENTYGFEGMIQGLLAIERQADQINTEQAQSELEAAREKTREWKKEFEELKNYSITPSISDEALDAATEKLKRWAEMIGQELDISKRILPNAASPEGEGALALPPAEVSLVIDTSTTDAVLQQAQAIAKTIASILTIPVRLFGTGDGAPAEGAEGFARGGYTGPGGKYQPAGIVHAGEHVQPQEVVREPGALSFLERIRRNGFNATMRGFRGYADGGMVMARAMPSIPDVPQSMLQPPAPGRDLGRAELVFPDGERVSMLADAENFDRLLRRTAMKKGRTRVN